MLALCRFPRQRRLRCARRRRDRPQPRRRRRKSSANSQVALLARLSRRKRKTAPASRIARPMAISGGAREKASPRHPTSPATARPAGKVRCRAGRRLRTGQPALGHGPGCLGPAAALPDRWRRFTRRSGSRGRQRRQTHLYQCRARRTLWPPRRPRRGRQRPQRRQVKKQVLPRRHRDTENYQELIVDNGERSHPFDRNP